jgi:hypothetical protein
VVLCICETDPVNKIDLELVQQYCYFATTEVSKMTNSKKTKYALLVVHDKSLQHLWKGQPKGPTRLSQSGNSQGISRTEWHEP